LFSNIDNINMGIIPPAFAVASKKGKNCNVRGRGPRRTTHRQCGGERNAAGFGHKIVDVNEKGNHVIAGSYKDMGKKNSEKISD